MTRLAAATDVSDADWRRVRGWLGDDSLRAVVDTLRYRDRSGLAWHLLPDDLVPADEARRFDELWRSTGVWQRLERELRPPAPPSRLVTLLRKLWQRLTRPSRTSDTDSIERLDRAVAADPWNPAGYLHRATLRLEAGDYPAGCRDAWRCLVLPACRGEWLWLTHRALAHGLAMQGRLDHALAHAHLAVCLKCSGDPQQTLLEAHEFLAEDVINHFAAYAVAEQLLARRRSLQRPGRTLYLPEDWVRNIGHLALIDFVVKATRLGWRAADEVVLIAPPAVTANLHFAAYWKTHVRVIDEPDEATAAGARALGERAACFLDLPDGSKPYFCEGMGRIQEAWERAGRAPLLALTDADLQHGRDALWRLGIPAGAWFVSLHVRTPGFYRESDASMNHHRNADVRTYLPVVAEVVRRGGWVVRLGEPSMPPLPSTPGLVDYAHNPLRSPRLDVFLCAACRFFVGVTSGMTHVPTAFGVPCVATNWSSAALPVYSRHDIFLPKLLRRGDGQILTFAEMLAANIRHLGAAWPVMRRHGLGVVDNTAGELCEVVAEMLDRLDGAFAEDEADRARQAAFAAVCRANGLEGFPRIGRDFLRRHGELLPGG